MSRSLQRQSLQLHLPSPISSHSISIFSYSIPSHSSPLIFNFPTKSSNKNYDSLTDHSFYESEANSELTKESCAREPTSSSDKKKEASKQASKNPSPSPPDDSSPPPSSDPQDEPEELSGLTTFPLWKPGPGSGN
ncbi:hypothetical protein DSO57_1026173 [Entomophthora muscae]|uniref:Uncharacterized protein n=1 Tax=Entomophthora muscae TaxID=34485 RepID=A0ACC2RGU2_9FUNG|nr:hypothetical protein DSO57_1026173 [Entomophthora muscae]